MTVSPAGEAILEILQRHVSPINARSLLRHALRVADLDEATVERRHFQELIPSLERSVSLFVDATAQRAIASALWGAAPTMKAPPPQVFELRTEGDVNTARVAARVLCAEVGAPSLAAQKIATAASELARNIVKYAGHGRVELSVGVGASRRFRIQAVDDGPGIPHLEEVFSGRYRSRTGMGLGLAGTKRLADHFEIKTGLGGTTIVVEVKL